MFVPGDKADAKGAKGCQTPAGIAARGTLKQAEPKSVEPKSVEPKPAEPKPAEAAADKAAVRTRAQAN